jgi:hypothetical protein
MTHPYGEYVYSTRGLLSRGFMHGCEKKFASFEVQFARAINAAPHPAHTS